MDEIKVLTFKDWKEMKRWNTGQRTSSPEKLLLNYWYLSPTFLFVTISSKSDCIPVRLSPGMNILYLERGELLEPISENRTSFIIVYVARCVISAYKRHIHDLLPWTLWLPRDITAALSDLFIGFQDLPVALTADCVTQMTDNTRSDVGFWKTMMFLSLKLQIDDFSLNSDALL